MLNFALQNDYKCYHHRYLVFELAAAAGIEKKSSDFRLVTQSSDM